ncbi:hypothetical protein Q7O_002731 [Pectobacterium carotovorum subsp. carotovorum PCCS1]|nr:hypothetical protein [Pectobacterium carotovorum subsp. carotovorum PCCS1]
MKLTQLTSFLRLTLDKIEEHDYHVQWSGQMLVPVYSHLECCLITLYL